MGRRCDHADQANVPIVVAGVGVHPGQYVFADDSGAVVIPEPDIDAVLDGAVTVGKEEAAFRAQAGHFGRRVDPAQGVGQCQGRLDVAGGPAAGEQYSHGCLPSALEQTEPA